MRSTSASVAFERSMAQLQEAVVGEMDPPPPWVIPLRDYYEESERQQNELIQFQREQLSRLERAGLVPQHPPPSRAAEGCGAVMPSGGTTPGGGGGGSEFDRSRSRPARSMSFAANFLRGCRRGTEGRNSMSTTRKQSLLLLTDGGAAGGGSSNNLLRSTPLIRKQSSVGLGALLSDGMSSNESRTSFAQSSPASPSSAHLRSEERGAGSPVGDGSATTQESSGSGGGIRATSALQEVLKYDANGRPILLKPIYNPYRDYNAEDATQQQSLRPHTLALLARSTFEAASQRRDPQEALRHGQEQVRATAAAVAPSHRAVGVAVAAEGGPKRQAAGVAARMLEWRAREDEQLEIHRRQEVHAVCQERDQWDHLNRRERSILLKVDSVQRKAASIQAAKTYERQRLDDLKVSSRHRVALDCLCGAEDAFRRRIAAAEESIFADIMGTMCVIA